MPITLAQIANKHTTVSRHFEEGSLNISYDPNMITEDVFARMSSLGQSGDEASMFAAFRTFNEMLVSLIVEWDLLENDGSVIPLTVERMARVPIPIRALVIDMIMRDIRPEMLAPQTPS